LQLSISGHYTPAPMPFDFSSYQAVLLDLDGTIYHEDHCLPGAKELVERLEREKRIFACLTNSTTSPHRLAARLARMGMNIPPDHIYTAAAAAADYVMEKYAPRPKLFNLATEGLEEMLGERVQWVHSAAEACDAVIAGAPANVYATEERQRIALHLLRGGSNLIGVCADRVYPSPRGIEFGSGAFCAFLAYGANVQPFYCGKPQLIFFQNLCAKMHVEPRNCLLIGDNLESDIWGGKRLGMKTILTCTGVTTRAQSQNPPEDHRPDWVIADLREL
jgi:HAD superfamily hydrolase (TIGR01450 family)